MNFTASGWLVWRLTHSGAALGVNSALAFGPMLILGAWGGVLADRFNKRKILIIDAERLRGARPRDGDADRART